MSQFTKPLTVTKIGPRTWKVERSFIYYLKDEEGEHIKVPKGFKTDFASVPRPLWWLVPPDGRYTQAAVLHDYLYFSKIYPRQKADLIFYQAMRVLKVPFWKRWAMHKSVRLFGWLPWGKHRARDK